MPIDTVQLFTTMHCDAVQWKAQRIWQNVSEPDEQTAAIEALATMLSAITNEIKRSAYIKQIAEGISDKAATIKAEIETCKKKIADNNKQITKLAAKKNLTDADTFYLTACKADVESLTETLTQLQASSTTALPEKTLKKAVDEAIKKLEAEKAKAKEKAMLANKVSNAEDAGLPSDFKGSKDDIFNALKYGIYVHDDVYYSRGGKNGDYPISNFTMKILYHVDTSEDNSFRLITVKNVYGFEVVINLNTDDFVALGSFKKVLARKGDFIFKGSDSDLTRLQEYLQKDELKTVYVNTLGYHTRGKFWAWCNGIMPLESNEENITAFMPTDEHGIVNYQGKNYFIPAGSKMFAEKDDKFVNEKKFKYIQARDHFYFNEWAKLLKDTYGNKSIIAILFYIGSLFRDITMKQIQRYPLLNLFGPPGAGKGQMAESIMAMFGEKQDQIMLGGASTIVGFMRKFAQFKNAIVWLDEYKNNLPVKFIESFKNIYDGKGYERGKMTNDFATESTPISSSCILSGQDMPTQEPALFMRCIMVGFAEGKFTEKQRSSFIKLKNDYESYGLSYITADIFKHRKLIQNSFQDTVNSIFKEVVREVNNSDVDDRMMMNISILLTYQKLLNDVLQFPFTYSEAKAFLIKNMLEQHHILAGNNDVSKFWGVVESLYYQGIIKEDTDFKLADGYLYLRLMNVHPLYVKELKSRGDVNYLSKSTMEHYLKQDAKTYLGYERKRFEDGSNNWCYKMKYANLGIDMIRVKEYGGENPVEYEKRLQRRYEEMGVPMEPYKIRDKPEKTTNPKPEMTTEQKMEVPAEEVLEIPFEELDNVTDAGF
ncbi:hypothetical protein ACFOW1_01770 [Parasediminibacterium paludis]|uniref:DNA primase DnaB-helicase binding domain-containing protein n=1 Tax=Parasediminibacterium paludis TaxID=908966 RepID=A0ABV8PTM3_9BACT